jgi:hypothetical protein
MATNQILEELYEARAQIMEQYGNDLSAYLHDAAERTRESNHPVAKIKQRRVRGTTPAKSSELAVDDATPSPGDR